MSLTWIFPAFRNDVLRGKQVIIGCGGGFHQECSQPYSPVAKWMEDADLPQWDDPNGQLPGTGIPGDTGDSLYRSSSLRRRRDASPVTRTVESVGQEGVGVVPERPSLFSTSGSSSFNPFSAALSSLRPEERAEVNQTGVSEALQRYANQEMRRLFAEHLRSLPQEPISSSFDLFGLSSNMVTWIKPLLWRVLRASA